MLNERGKPTGEFTGIGCPIAQGAGVIISLAEPSVIQHEHFGAQFGGGRDEPANGLLVNIKVHALPAIEQGAARFLAMGDDAAAHVAVEAAAGVPRSTGAEGEDGRGKLQFLLRLQEVGTVGKMVPHGELYVAVDAAFELHVVVAAPRESTEQAEPVFFVCGGCP